MSKATRRLVFTHNICVVKGKNACAIYEGTLANRGKLLCIVRAEEKGVWVSGHRGKKQVSLLIFGKHTIVLPKKKKQNLLPSLEDAALLSCTTAVTAVVALVVPVLLPVAASVVGLSTLFYFWK